ncbi:MAG TPA: hypothetical protein VLL05_21535 [Terriglobales bacterium]|nr:hypothetical protein [Terriglobales bacterium]
MSAQLYLRRPRVPSWAERHHFAIGLSLICLGFAAVKAIQFFGVKGSFATLLGSFAAFALLFGRGFVRNRGPIFPPSEITRENRWKYSILAASLWGTLFLVWWYRVRPLIR